MKCPRYLLAVSMLAFSVQARAFTVDDIYDDVIDIWNTVTGDVKDTARDLKQQLDAVTTKGQTIRDAVQDALDLVQHRQTPLLDFVKTPGNPNVRCGGGSECMDFRLDLENFVLDMAQLKDRFPQIEKHGLGDGTIIADVIDFLPPLVLFGLYETLNKVPNWQDTPQNLADLFDEIGDPDAFSEEPLDASPVTVATITSTAAKAGASRGGGQANFGAPLFKLDIFCSKGKQLRDDPVRLNRIRAGWSWVANLLDGGAELISDGIVIVAVGEGGKYPIHLKGFLKLTGKVIESIFASVDAYRANLGLCRQIETDVAQHANLVDYRDAKGVSSAYWVVHGILEARSNSAADQSAATAKLDAAGDSFGAGNMKQAYKRICDAYAQLI